FEEELAKHSDLWPYVLLAVGVIVVLLLLRRFLLRRKKGEDTLPAEPTINVAELCRGGELLGPPGTGPALEFYNLPVRLVAVAIAPVGRLHETPARDELPEIIDCILPGLDHINDAHAPAVYVWPRQVSVRGFAHSFFTHVKLPDEHEKKNPWSLVAGLFKVDDQPMMAGLVLQSDEPNRHGQYIMEKEEDWLGILRIRQR
ncbi:MAG: hypothetical protein U9N87_01830, partial [Planctomycetota bacterium]|nr:hypothetical protein [Planctomycetota bacterium]